MHAPRLLATRENNSERAGGYCNDFVAPIARHAERRHAPLVRVPMRISTGVAAGALVSHGER
jgi:hypothetical protein